MQHPSNLAHAGGRPDPELERLSVDALRMLAVDMVELLSGARANI